MPKHEPRASAGASGKMRSVDTNNRLDAKAGGPEDLLLPNVLGYTTGQKKQTKSLGEMIGCKSAQEKPTARDLAESGEKQVRRRFSRKGEASVSEYLDYEKPPANLLLEA